MYWFTMWLDLAESTIEADLGQFDTKTAKLTALIASTFEGCHRPSIQRTNVLVVLHYSVCHNHRGDTHARLLRVLEWITTHLPGSHGLVYWYDDECADKYEYDPFDGYRVIVVAKGKLTDRYDPFLSPRSVHVEDPEYE